MCSGYIPPPERCLCYITLTVLDGDVEHRRACGAGTVAMASVRRKQGRRARCSATFCHHCPVTEPDRKLRVFIGLTEVAGYFSKLRDGFRELGCRCDFVTLSDDRRQYAESDSPMLLVNFLRWVDNREIVGRFLLPRRVLFTALQVLGGWLLAIWAAFRYDVFVFSSNTSFLSSSRVMRYWDLPFLRLCRKIVISVHLGSEARPAYVSRRAEQTLRGESALSWIAATRAQAAILDIVERHSTCIVSHPPMAHFLKRPFVQLLAIGLPTIAVQSKENLRSGNDRVRIVHAPSNPELKGTAEIRKIVSELQADGLPVDYVELIDRTNHEVIAELQHCDVVVDQLYSDTPLAMLAMEAASCGTPTVVGGYYSDQMAQDVPGDFIPPSVFCHPDNLQTELKAMVLDRERREAIGAAAFEFVSTRWRARDVAERYLTLARGVVPAEWMFDPQDIRYLYGVGLPDRDVAALVCMMVTEGGAAALQLDDKPALLNAFTSLGVDEGHPDGDHPSISQVESVQNA